MDNTYLITRVPKQALKKMLDADYDDLITFMEEQPHVYLEDIDTFMSIIEDHPALSEFRYIGPHDFESNVLLFTSYLDDEQITYLANLLENERFSTEDEFFDDFEELVKPANDLRDLLVAAKCNNESVLLHPDLRGM